MDVRQKTKSEHQLLQQFSMKTRHNTVATLAATLITFGSLSGGANAAVAIIGDPGGEGGNGEGTALGVFSNTAQIVYGSTLLSAAGLDIGDQITGISFRVDNTGLNPVGGPSPVWSVADYQIRLATSLNAPGNLDPNFINNRGSDYSVVRLGPLSYNGTEYPTGGSPNLFGPTIQFDNSFTYSGGDLLLEYTHSPISSGGAWVDANNALPLAQSQFSAGYNTTTEGFSGFGDDYAPIIRLTFTAVPEPSSTLLFGLGALGFVSRRKRTT